MRCWSSPDSTSSAAKRLPEEFRAAVYLADIEGYAYKEIAQIMGTPAVPASWFRHKRPPSPRLTPIFSYRAGRAATATTSRARKKRPTLSAAADVGPANAKIDVSERCLVAGRIVSGH